MIMIRWFIDFAKIQSLDIEISKFLVIFQNYCSIFVFDCKDVQILKIYFSIEILNKFEEICWKKLLLPK